MKFSIITPTLNDEGVIARTVRSLDAQDYSRDLMEWILVDGGSKDGTLERVKGERFHPDVWESEGNGGFFDALNRGVAMATGDVVCFLGAGDRLASRSTLFRLSGAFVNSGAACVYADWERGVEGAEGFVRRGVVRPGIFYRRSLAWGWFAPLRTLCVRREVLLGSVGESGGVFDVALGGGAGLEWGWRLIGRDGVEPAYLRIPTVQCSGPVERVPGAAVWRALGVSGVGGVLAWLGFQLRGRGGGG